jgi:hypothetical protein
MNPELGLGEGVQRAPSLTIERRWKHSPRAAWESWEPFTHAKPEITHALLLWLTEGEAKSVRVEWRDGGFSEFRLRDEPSGFAT